MAALLWGDATDETAVDNFRTCVWGLRKSLGDTEHRIVVSEGGDISLDAGPISAVASNELINLIETNSIETRTALERIVNDQGGSS